VVRQSIQVPGPSAEPRRVEEWVAMLELLAMRLATRLSQRTTVARPLSSGSPPKQSEVGSDAARGVTSLVADELRRHEKARFRLGYFA